MKLNNNTAVAVSLPTFFLFVCLFVCIFFDQANKKIIIINLSLILVNKGTKSKLGWTKYSDFYGTVHPNLEVISLCLLNGAECGKGLYTWLTVNNKNTFTPMGG